MPSQGSQQPSSPSSRGTAELLRGLRPVEATRLADHVVDRIRDLILREGLDAGERLPSERDLATRFGTSRAIVSQALRTLSIMGLVEVRPGSGAYVTRNPQAMMTASLDLLVRSEQESADHLAELRYWLEGVGARRALVRSTGSSTTELEAAFERLQTSAGETSAWIAADTIFHAALVRAAGNPYLVSLYEAVHTSVLSIMYEGWVERDVSPAWLTGPALDAQLGLHRPILEAMRGRDERRMRTALDAHHRALLDHLRARTAP